MGNPNVGKSVIFSRLTGIEVVSANYPGTTVEYTEGRMKLGEVMATLVDAPGVYSLDPHFQGGRGHPRDHLKRS